MTKLVWIDAGYGGKDNGGSGKKLKEKDKALEISLGIKKLLESLYENVQVLLSRSTDVFVELGERTAKANVAGADILISVHLNAGGGAGGFESYRYTSSSNASILPQNRVHQEIVTALKPFGVKDRGKKKANLQVLRESHMPAILTENLFVDVPADAERLMRQEVIEALVSGHVNGIAKHLGLTKKKLRFQRIRSRSGRRRAENGSFVTLESVAIGKRQIRLILEHWGQFLAA